MSGVEQISGDRGVVGKAGTVRCRAADQTLHLRVDVERALRRAAGDAGHSAQAVDDGVTASLQRRAPMDEVVLWSSQSCMCRDLADCARTRTRGRLVGP